MNRITKTAADSNSVGTRRTPPRRRRFSLSKLAKAVKSVLKAASFGTDASAQSARAASVARAIRRDANSDAVAALKHPASSAAIVKPAARQEQSIVSAIGYEEVERRLRDIEEAPRFPIDALGELSALATILSTELQVDPALAGACLLFAMNVATTGHFNVQVHYNPSAWKPTTLNLHTLAHSGQGKTTTDNAVLGPLRAVFREQAKEFAKRSADEKGGRRHQHRFLEDITEAAFVSELAGGPRMQVLCTSEGAAFYYSPAMNKENMPKTAASFCKLWDDGGLSRVRLTTARTELFGCRVPLHIAVQPEVIETFLADRTLNKCGYWPRNLLAICRPPGQRVLRLVELEQHSEFRTFADRCRHLAAQLEPARAEDCRQIGWEPEAIRAVTDYFNQKEAALARGEFIDIDAWVRRATDQVDRIAATFAAFAGRAKIRRADVDGAVQIVDYSLACWRFVQSGDRGAALGLWKWVQEQGGSAETGRTLQYGPSSTRTQAKRDAAIDLLRAKGLMRRDGNVITLT